MAFRLVLLLSRPNSILESYTLFVFSSSSPFCSSTEPNRTRNSELKLTHEELTRINLLMPRLCLSGHLKTATQLTVASLHANPPRNSLSLSFLIHALTSQPDLIQPMSLLTRLRHTSPAHNHLTPITGMLITSYLKKGRPKDALKIYNWVRRPGSVCDVEPRVYGVLINAFCRNGFVIEGLRVLRDMVDTGLAPGEGLRRRVFRSLLKEARVKEATELDQALVCLVGVSGSGNESVKKVIALLDQMIANWIE